MAQTNATMPSILILGAGPIGLTLASELRRHGVPCRIVDKAEATTKWSKALVVHARTMEVFERMGVLPVALDRGRRVRGASIHSQGREVLRIDLDTLDAPHNFFLDLNQSDTEALLEEHLNRLGGQVEWRTETVGLVDEGGAVAVTLRDHDGHDETGRYDYVCACDGAHSFAREALKLDFPGGRNAAQFLLADVKLDWDRAPDQWYADIMPAALFFAAGLKEPGRWRVITELPRDGSVPVPASLAKGGTPTLDELKAILKVTGPNGVQASDPVWLSWFKVNHRILDRFRVGRVFFAGDAAHLHPPVGGQGMNIGIHDAFNLGWKLALVAKGAAPEALLDSYNAERRPAAGSVVEFTDTALNAGIASTPIVRQLRDGVVRLVNRLPAVKNQLERIISEVNVSYRGSPIVKDRPYLARTGVADLQRQRMIFEGPQAGDRAPDGRLRRDDESVERLHPLLTGTGFHVLYFADPRLVSGPLARPGQALSSALRARYGEQVTMIEVTPEPKPPEDGHLRLRDDHGATRKAYGAAGEALYVIRPDGYVSYRALDCETAPLFKHLDGIWRPAAGASPVRDLPAEPKTTVSPALVAAGIGAALVAGWAATGRRSPAAIVHGPARVPALLLAGIFTFSGASKLAGVKAMREGFARWGYPQAFRSGVGLFELGSAAALANQPTREAGGAAVAALMAGAAGTHLRAREYKNLLPALALMGAALWIARQQRRESERT